jgi:hypothetical protein
VLAGEGVEAAADRDDPTVEVAVSAAQRLERPFPALRRRRILAVGIAVAELARESTSSGNRNSALRLRAFDRRPLYLVPVKGSWVMSSRLAQNSGPIPFRMCTHPCLS